MRFRIGMMIREDKCCVMGTTIPALWIIFKKILTGSAFVGAIEQIQLGIFFIEVVL